MNNSEWTATLADALAKRTEETDQRTKFLSQQQTDPKHGPWDAWGDSLARTASGGERCLVDTHTGRYIANIREYRSWRENRGYKRPKSGELELEWAYLLENAPERCRQIWSVESADEILLWDARTGTWLQ